MCKRKCIGLITAIPESIHATRVCEGIFKQCDKYGYNVAVFAPMTHLSSKQVEYIAGELNIFELINFDLLDAVIVDSISLIEDNDDKVKKYIEQKLKKECKSPVVSLNLPMADYPMIESQNESVFRNIAEHVIKKHHVTDICFLTGPKGYLIAEERLKVFLEVMEEHGIEVRPEWIIYGDFWYTCGKQLANQIASGEIAKPQAVICASDHMAIGLANELQSLGIHVPEDIIITGFEATQEAALNSISITSYESNEAKTAADAIDVVRKILEPEREIRPFQPEPEKHFHAGMSCGCEPDFRHSAKAFKDSFYYIYRDYSTVDDNIDIGQLMEGYAAEIFAESRNTQECLYNIYLNTFYMQPYSKYYLCLKTDWEASEEVITTGYPQYMKTVLHTTPVHDSGFYQEEKAETFETRLMLPQMFEESEEPAVFYFSPMHFRDEMFGYSVLQRSLKEEKKINLVYRNWLRNVNTSLEMIQTRNRLMQMSVYDEMTHAYNRHGMDIFVNKMLSSAVSGKYLFVAVIDMDGLKMINDTYGHAEGDWAIKQICKAIISSSGEKEICVRAGGDEFYLFGVGQYTEQDISRHIQKFEKALTDLNGSMKKEYNLSASIGIEVAEINDTLRLENVIHAADVKMYNSKQARKKQRL